MTVYYLIQVNRVTHEIDTDGGAVTALPLLAGGQAKSLINRAHILALMSRFNRTAAQIIDDLGLIDERPT